MKYKAVSDRIIVIPDPVEVSVDGILIPDASKNKPKAGLVVSVGPDCMEVRIGYKILFLEGHGAIFQEDDKDKLVLKESDVLCYAPPAPATHPEDAEFMVIRTEHKMEIQKMPHASWASVLESISQTLPTL